VGEKETRSTAIGVVREDPVRGGLEKGILGSVKLWADQKVSSGPVKGLEGTLVQIVSDLPSPQNLWVVEARHNINGKYLSGRGLR